jgi:hypothetical protein
MQRAELAFGAAVAIVAGMLGGCGGGLDHPKQFQRDASISGGAAAPSQSMSGSDPGLQSAGSGGSSGPSGTGMQMTPPANGGGKSVMDAAVDSGVIMDAGPPGPPVCVAHVFSVRCAGSGCHGAGSKQLDLVSPGVISRLVDKPSLPSLPCAGGVYIATDGGAPSLLLEKLDDAPACGKPMPPSGMLHKKDADCLTEWVISLGASESDAGTP